jgi:hypothetical protein
MSVSPVFELQPIAAVVAPAAPSTLRKVRREVAAFGSSSGVKLSLIRDS